MLAPATHSWRMPCPAAIIHDDGGGPVAHRTGTGLVVEGDRGLSHDRVEVVCFSHGRAREHLLTLVGLERRGMHDAARELHAAHQSAALYQGAVAPG